jgi:hypothetical protein
MENVGLFLKYITAIWYNSWPFGIVFGYLVLFFRFGMFGPRKIWQPRSAGLLNLVPNAFN